MKAFILLCALLMPFVSTASGAKPAPAATEKTIRNNLPDMSIQSIYTTPMPGVFEIQVGGNIYYTDRTGSHIINGHLFDMKTKQDITASRLAVLSRINWSDLPLDKAIVSGPEDGLKMAVFTDPDCPYCKRLEEQLANIDGLRIYTFLFPLTQLHPDAYAKSESIWCAKDQHKAMVKVMLQGKVLPKADCKTPLADIQQLASKLNVQGTPTIYSADGRKFVGGIPLDQIKTWLRQGS